jgi:serine/threonine-protein kinase
MPWSRVSFGGRVLGTTPLIRVRMPAGSHDLRLVNPEAGIQTTYRITIRPGETTARRLGLE